MGSVHVQGRGAQACRKRALLVGINSYPTRPLRGCLNDVAAFRELLVAGYGFDPGDVAELTEQRATRGAILRGLRALVGASEHGDSMVFYFCGHGDQLPTKDPRELDLLDEVLCPIEFDWTPETSILDNELREIFDSIPAGVRTTWVFDACHTGDIDEGLDEDIATYRSLSRAGAHAGGGAHRLGRGLRAEGAHGVILTACKSSERAADIDVGGAVRGAFSYHLARAAWRDPHAALRDLLDEVRRELHAMNQHPEAYGLGLDEPFLCTKELNVTGREPRSLMIPAQSSVESDRHLHAYLAEASRRSQEDADFGARLTDLGVDLSAISEDDALALAHAVKTSSRVESTACRTFWWGFHLELSSSEVAELAAHGITHAALVRTLEAVPHRIAPHLSTLVDYLANQAAEIVAVDRGAGVYISMSTFAPDLYVATPVLVRAAPRAVAEHAGSSAASL